MWKFLRMPKGSSRIGWICLRDWWAASQNDWPRFGLGVSILGSLVIYIYIYIHIHRGPTCKKCLATDYIQHVAVVSCGRISGLYTGSY